MSNQEFTQVTPHIARLELSGTSIYLVRGEAASGWTLVDAGPEKDTEAAIQAVESFTRGAKPQYLILTHGHPEQAGGALKLRQHWSLKVAAGREEIPYLTEPVFYRKIKAHSPQHYLTYLFAQPQMIGRGIDLPLDERMVIGGLVVSVAPGHAPGQVALLHRGDRALLCGDVFTTRGGLGDPPAGGTYDPRLNHLSQARLSLLDFDHLLASRGAPLMNDARQQAQAFAQKHLGKERFAKLQAAPAF